MSLNWPIQFCVFSTAATYIVSIITSNVSQVDRLWTFLPTIYTAYYALLPLFPTHQPFLLFPCNPLGSTDHNPRALLMFALVFLWMCRLSYNTHRRGLFNPKDEDYRWAVLRKQLPPWLFQIVNLTFISAIQNVLLLLLGLPTRTVALYQPRSSLETSDYALASLALLVLFLEFTADNQQYAYQTYKHAFLAKEKGVTDVKPFDESKQWIGARLSWTPDDARRGFITRGLWRYSRHPNFACEQSFWWIITFFPLVASGPPNLPTNADFPPLRIIIHALQFPVLHHPLLSGLRTNLLDAGLNLLPAAALSLLFLSSTLYTEAITSSKYPIAYKAYQKRVGMFQPTMTAIKAIALKFSGKRTQQDVDRLVWGDSQESKKE
ncbi:hypothetical protein K443DRAFT_678515 [Laccaria amethystina LaAM-08-1]|uniref:DUF1295-domain-containing protein n=1 Tax=Laccaria amethystina LaAM-08-1 TaxID=1095629 RepID=A0A0C9WRJ9_9AGAR|nr:hypothetical protein K443DRAFT_678515 [Laccaria amethystina LaAM-08-1]